MSRRLRFSDAADIRHYEAPPEEPSPSSGSMLQSVTESGESVSVTASASAPSSSSSDSRSRSGSGSGSGSGSPSFSTHRRLPTPQPLPPMVVLLDDGERVSAEISLQAGASSGSGSGSVSVSSSQSSGLSLSGSGPAVGSESGTSLSSMEDDDRDVAGVVMPLPLSSSVTSDPVLAFFVPELCNPEVCVKWVEKAETLGFEPAGVLYKNNQKVPAALWSEDERASMSEAVARGIHPLVRAGLVPPKWGAEGWEVVGVSRRVVVSRYSRGHHFLPHFDTPLVHHDRLQSRMTVIVYLNEAFEGGLTHFIDPNSASISSTSCINSADQTEAEAAAGANKSDVKISSSASSSSVASSSSSSSSSSASAAVSVPAAAARPPVLPRRTSFRRGNVLYSQRPQIGGGLVFQHANVLHESELLRNGTKYILRADIMYAHPEADAATKADDVTTFASL